MAEEIKLKLKYRRASKGTQGSHSSNGGEGRKHGVRFKGELERAQAATVANRPTMHINAEGKTIWLRPSSK